MLNKTTQLSCKIISALDAPDTFINLTALRRLTLTNDESRLMPFPYVVGDNITVTRDLIAGQEISVPFEITLKETGLWEISVSAKHSTGENSWYGGLDTIYLTVSSDNSKQGWPDATPIKPIKSELGDTDGIVLPDSGETSNEDPPPPPATWINRTPVDTGNETGSP